MRTQPRCPEGHGPMIRVPADLIADKRASEFGVWWACGERGCDRSYIEPSYTLLLAASLPVDSESAMA